MKVCLSYFPPVTVRNSSNFDLNSWAFPDCFVPAGSNLALAATAVLVLAGAPELCTLLHLVSLWRMIVHCEADLCLVQKDRSVTEAQKLGLEGRGTDFKSHSSPLGLENVLETECVFFAGST